jgi:hypothetical protein
MKTEAENNVARLKRSEIRGMQITIPNALPSPSRGKAPVAIIRAI